jgi:AmmeMemoRadiSam system protein B
MSQGFIRPPAVAGMFYPQGVEPLRSQIAALLSSPPPGGQTPSDGGRLKALIVPHAGYVYSGPIAAQAYRLLLPLRGQIERVVLLGPAHRVYVSAVASSGASRFDTPLGSLSVDQEFQRRAEGPHLIESRHAHQPEHCLEVQLPFLQEVLGQPRIVPLLVSDAAPERVAAVLEALWGGPETLIVISSDLSHYLPYAQARRSDTDTADRILSCDTTLDGEQACGCAAINGLLFLARRRGLRPQLLDLRSSGDTAGSRAEVVGYAAFALHEDTADHSH